MAYFLSGESGTESQFTHILHYHDSKQNYFSYDVCFTHNSHLSSFTIEFFARIWGIVLLNNEHPNENV